MGRREIANVMDTEKLFKHSGELREYWRLAKRKQRAHVKVAMEVKTKPSERVEGGEGNNV
jgi:hypothetical protein